MGKVLTVGNPLLRKVSKNVENIQEILPFIEELFNTMTEEDGVGIAAPQYGYNINLFIMYSKSNSRYPDAPESEPIILINPKIIEHSEETEYGLEGCLSVPKMRGLVKRYKWLKVQYTDINGNIIEDTFQGFIARIFQHEYDHLLGLLYIDKVEKHEDLFFL